VSDGNGIPGVDRTEEASGPSRLSLAAVVPLKPQDEAAVPSSGKDPPRPPRTGEVGAKLDELMAAHGDAIYSLCLRVLGDPVDAEDALQQVFLQAHRDFARFEGRSTPRTWLFSIAINRCKDAIKAARRRGRKIQADPAAVMAFEDPGDGPEAQLAQRQQFVDLAHCLSELSDDACLAVLARFQLGMTYEEMAPMLNAKADTLQTRVQRAMPMLKRCMERKGWTSV
jgi:RNA polymerase sigma-70 factor (ECF subfamily)